MTKKKNRKTHKIRRKETKPYVQKLSIEKGIGIWNIAKYFLAIVNSFAAIASILGFIFTITGQIDESTIKYIVGGILFLILLCTTIFVIISNKTDKMIEACKYSKGFHESLHFLRDCYGDLIVTEGEGTYYNRPLAFRKYMTEEMMKLMDIISESLTEAIGHKVRACLKTFGSLSIVVV